MKLKNGLLLLLTAGIWGVAFVAQSVGMDYVEPFTFNTVRSLIGGLVLIPVILLFGEKKDAGKAAEVTRKERRTLLLGGVCCGTALCLASNFQQFGVKYTTVGKAGFITACYIVIVPVIGVLLAWYRKWRKRADGQVPGGQIHGGQAPGGQAFDCQASGGAEEEKAGNPMIWAAVALAVAGLYLLCMEGDSLQVSMGDGLVMVCAFLFSLHILVIDYFSPMTDGVKMSCIQFFVCGILSAVGMVLFEEPSLSQIAAAWAPILYAGVMSCGVAYTLQIVGQKGMNPTICSLILSLESSISVLAGWVILGQALSDRQLAGCGIMLGAIILAQLPSGRKEDADCAAKTEAGA